MKFIQHYSGSKGNLYELNCCGDRLIIDPGVSWNKLLSALDFNLVNIKACLVTHEDKDHCKSASAVALATIPVCATKETLDNIELLNKRNSHCIAINKWHKIGNFRVYPFTTYHDCEGSVGYMVRHNKDRLLFVTDTACITQNFSRFDFDIIAIECNFDEDLIQENVEDGLLNEAVARRTISTHMSKQLCKEFLANHIKLDCVKELHLIHLSQMNIEKSGLAEEFETEFMIKTIVK